MPNSPKCPSVDVLKQLALGQLPDPPASHVEQHVLDCEPCAQATLNLAANETVVGAMRRGVIGNAKPFGPASSEDDKGIKANSVALPDRVNQLIARMRDLPTRELSDVDSATVLSGEAGLEAMHDIDWSTCFAASQSPDEIGRLADFRVLKLLGHGGMVGVFLAEDMQLGRRVALKIMRPEFASRPGATERFLREAKAVAAVHDEHIVTIYQVGQATVPGQKQGVPFLAQELLQGEPLDARLQREGQLPISDAVSIAKQMAEGLTAAHERGLIHRDIKPANVFLQSSRHAPRDDSRGETDVVHTQGVVGANEPQVAIGFPHVEREGYVAKLLDFGLARSVGDTANLTQSGIILGTPAYMAPEQARGETVDARADLFSLGCVLYRMLTGKSAFGGKDVMATLMSLATDEPPTPQTIRADVPSELSDFVMRLLAKDRDARPASAREVVRQLVELGVGDVGMRVAGATRLRSSVALATEIPNVTAIAKLDSRVYVPRRGSRVALLGLAAIAFIALLAVVIVKFKTKDGKETEVAINVPGDVDSATVSVRNGATDKPGVATGQSPFDALDPAAIPAAERFDWQPKELVAVIGSHRQRLWGSAAGVALSGDGSLCLAGGHYCHGMLVDVKNGKTLPTPTLPAQSVGVSPDGTMLFWKQEDGKLGLQFRDGDTWKPREMSLPKAVTYGNYQPWDATFSLDGRWLATSILHEVLDETPKYSTYVWDVSVDPPQRVVQLDGYKHPRFSPDGKRLAVIAAQDGSYSLQVFDLGELPPKRHAVVPGMEFPREVGFTLKPRHGYLASGKLVALDKAGTLAVWDVSTSDPMLVARRELTKEGYASLCPFPTGNDHLVLFKGDSFSTWRLHESSLSLEFSSPDQLWRSANIHDVAVSQDGHTMASSHLNGMVKLWDVAEDGLREKNPIRPQPVHRPSSIVLAPDGKHFVTPSEDGFQVWRLNGPACQQLDSSNSMGQAGGPIGFVNSTQFTTAGFPMSQWKIDGDRITPVGELSNQIIPLAGGPGGLILSVDSNKPTTNLLLWQADKLPGKQIISWEATPPGRAQFGSHDRYAYSVSADGNRLVSADRVPIDGSNPVIRVWQRSEDATVLMEMVTISLPGDQLHQLALSPDGQLLAVATQGGLSLWKLGADKAERLWQKYEGYAQAVTFSHDGKQVASSAVRTEGLGSGNVTIHNLQGDRTHRWTYPNYPASIALATDGHHLLTANTNGTVYILRIPELSKN